MKKDNLTQADIFGKLKKALVDFLVGATA